MAGGVQKYRNVVRAVGGHLRRERKRGVVSGDKIVIAAVIQQLHCVSRAVDHADQCSADGKRRLRAHDAHRVDIAGHRSSPVDHNADLRRIRGLGLDRDGIAGAARLGRRKRKADIARP